MINLTQGHLTLYTAIKARGLSRGCADISKEELGLVTKDQWVEFCRAYHIWNGDLEDFDPNRPILGDYCVIDFVDHILMEEYVANRSL
jgi:hypothetical protein